MIIKGKRGQEIISFLFFTIFGIMLAAFFFFAVMSKVKTATDDTSFQRRFYARDMALFIDSLHAANGNLTTFYEAKMDFDFVITDSRVIMTNRENRPFEKRSQISYSFGINNYTNVIPVFVNRSLGFFYFRANNDEISLLQPKEVKLKNILKLMLDPGKLYAPENIDKTIYVIEPIDTVTNRIRVITIPEKKK